MKTQRSPCEAAARRAEMDVERAAFEQSGKHAEGERRRRSSRRSGPRHPPSGVGRASPYRRPPQDAARAIELIELARADARATRARAAPGDGAAEPSWSAGAISVRRRGAASRRAEPRRRHAACTIWMPRALHAAMAPRARGRTPRAKTSQGADSAMEPQPEAR